MATSHCKVHKFTSLRFSMCFLYIGIDKVVIMEITSSNNKIVPVTFQAGVDALTFDESIRVDILNG